MAHWTCRARNLRRRNRTKNRHRQLSWKRNLLPALEAGNAEDPSPESAQGAGGMTVEQTVEALPETAAAIEQPVEQAAETSPRDRAGRRAFAVLSGNQTGLLQGHVGAVLIQRLHAAGGQFDPNVFA